MPPEAVVRPWMLVYYTVDQGETPERYWQRSGSGSTRGTAARSRSTPRFAPPRSAAVKDAADDEARLRKLYDFLTTEVANTSYDLDEGPAASRPRTKENNTTADVWKQKSGTSYDITLLYIAFAQALGYEARLARVSRRDYGGFVPNLKRPVLPARLRRRGEGRGRLEVL